MSSSVVGPVRQWPRTAAAEVSHWAFMAGCPKMASAQKKRRWQNCLQQYT